MPGDDTIARMYERAIERLEAAGLRPVRDFEFRRPGFESRHNLRYWQRRPYLGVGLDASSMLACGSRLRRGQANRYVLRSTTTDDLKAYLAGTARRRRRGSLRRGSTRKHGFWGCG